jgi:predicted O-methyltransferase YrrM
LPYIRGLYRQTLEYKQNSCYPPGHFYSPIVSVKEIKKNEDQIWPEPVSNKIMGIELNTVGQLETLKEISKYYSHIPFKSDKQDSLRYYFENGYYSYSDGVILFLIINHLKPKRIIEIGSGFSSALMFDTNQLFFGGGIKLTFIEPNPERLFSIIQENDRKDILVLTKRVQDVNKELFEQLDRNDILFIDSTHVSKTGSDVNFILFEILPKLKSGVFIHFHDIAYPFEYPKDWVFGGRNWNENYLLKAFLMYNKEFGIYLFTHYMHLYHREAFANIPLTYKNIGGTLWIEKK